MDILNQNLSLDGSRIHDISSFYEEINRVFMRGENWQLGNSLDALDDLLYGGYGALNGAKTVTIIWKDFERSRAALGQETTRTFYLSKLAQPAVYDAKRVRRELYELERGTGPTYFDIILEIIAGHPNIMLVKE